MIRLAEDHGAPRLDALCAEALDLTGVAVLAGGRGKVPQNSLKTPNPPNVGDARKHAMRLPFTAYRRCPGEISYAVCE